jgi:hypothetical protein
MLIGIKIIEIQQKAWKKIGFLNLSIPPLIYIEFRYHAMEVSTELQLCLVIIPEHDEATVPDRIGRKPRASRNRG